MHQSLGPPPKPQADLSGWGQRLTVVGRLTAVALDSLLVGRGRLDAVDPALEVMLHPPHAEQDGVDELRSARKRDAASDLEECQDRIVYLPFELPLNAN